MEQFSKAAVAVGAWVAGFAFILFSIRNLNAQLDDALIYARYVRNVIEGHGLVYNEGERFNGLTSPFFSYLCTAGALVFHDVLEVINGLSALFLGATAVAWYGLWAKRGLKVSGTLGACALVLSPYFYLTSGMETSLFLFLTLAAIWFFEEGRAHAAMVVFALLIVTRAEAVFLIASVGVVHLALRRKNPPAIAVVAPALIVSAVWAFNALYYGQATPHTAMVKFWQGQSGYWGEWPFGFVTIGYQLDWFWGGRRWFLAAVLAFSVLGAWSTRTTIPTRVLFLNAAFQAVVFFVLNVPNYHWYYGLFYLVVLGFAGVGLGQFLTHTRGLPRALALATVAVGLYALGALGSRATLGAGPYPGYAQVGEWLARNTEASATVALVEVGTVGWYSRRPLIDILGLVTPKTGRFIKDRDLNSWLKEYSPDYILIHEPSWNFETAAVAAAAAGHYADARDFRVAGYRLLHRVSDVGGVP